MQHPDNIERMAAMRLTITDKIQDELRLERQKVAEKDEVLMAREITLMKQDSVLNFQKTAIEKQKEAINIGKEDLVRQNEEIDKQKIVLGNQVVQIENQRNLLLIFIAVVLIISLLLYFAIRNFRQKKSAMAEVLIQKELIEEKHLEIQDSISYAKRIQTAILPPSKLFKYHIPNSFVLYLPKDVVAGDFYWMEVVKNKVLFAAADCTGHGVPGAMVSVICNNGLNRSVREFGLTKPGLILDKTREIIIQEFAKSEEEVKDGMDIAMCSLEGNTLEFAGAHNPLWIIRSGANEVEEIKADNQPIGQFEHIKPFRTQQVNLEKGDSIYIFSDGFADQFGGKKGKKFKTANFKQLLISIQDKPIEKHEQLIIEAFENWKGNLEQLDDVCIIGLRI